MRRASSSLIAIAAAASTALLSACGGPESAPVARAASRAEPPRASIAPPTLRPDIQAVLYRGNEEFEAADYEAALASYGDAVGADSTVAAGWFGLYMSHTRLGNEVEAKAARDRLRALATPVPGDPHASPTGAGPGAPTGTGPATPQNPPESGR